MRSFAFSRFPLFLALSLSSFLVFSPGYPPLLTYISFLTPSQTFPCLVYVSPSLPSPPFSLFSPFPWFSLYSFLDSPPRVSPFLHFYFPTSLSASSASLFRHKKSPAKAFRFAGSKKDSFVCARKLAPIFIRFYNDSVFTALIFRGGNFQKLRYPPKDAAVPLPLANGSST